jgi:hypothetical protein
MPVPALLINVGKKRAGNDIAKIVKIHIITLDLFEILVNSGTTAFVLTIEKIGILKNNNIKATGSIKNPINAKNSEYSFKNQIWLVFGIVKLSKFEYFSKALE